MRDDAPLTRSLHRFQTLLAALQHGPASRAELFEQLGTVYPLGASRRPMVDRDVRSLRALGIVIDISATRPPI